MAETTKDKPSFAGYCGFCGKSNKEVRCLIAGPQTFICNECVFLFVEVLRGRGIVDDGGKRENVQLCMLQKVLDVREREPGRNLRLWWPVCGLRNDRSS